MSANAAQIDYWNSAGGLTWARFQDQLDRQMAPFGHVANDALAPQPGEHILDIGCGCGHTSLTLAQHIAPHGSVLGLDISKPMLEIAQRRSNGQSLASFVEDDAQVTGFGGKMFDAAFSRFGVMFFSDPTAAFANIRRALRPNGRLAFVCWRPFEDNLWMRDPLEAAQHLLPEQKPVDPLTPGPFAFADANRIQTILADAGFANINIARRDIETGALPFDEALDVALRVGALGFALRQNPEFMKDAASALRPILMRYLTAGGVSMPASIWVVTAENPEHL